MKFTSEQYLEQAKELHDKRQRRAANQQLVKEMQDKALAALMHNPEYMIAQAGIEDLTPAIVALEETLKEGTLQHFTDTGSKKFLGGVGGVRTYKNYNYDPKKAIKYAIEHDHPTLLKLDTTKFKKFASVTEVDFVEITEDPRPNVASDLSKVLE